MHHTGDPVVLSELVAVSKHVLPIVPETGGFRYAAVRDGSI
jgi:hypothetical protein